MVGRGGARGVEGLGGGRHPPVAYADVAEHPVRGEDHPLRDLRVDPAVPHHLVAKVPLRVDPAVPHHLVAKVPLRGDLDLRPLSTTPPRGRGRHASWGP